MKIAHITPKADFTLLIESEEGQSGLFDVRPYLELEAFRPLQDADEFSKFKMGVTSSNGIAVPTFRPTQFLQNGCAQRSLPKPSLQGTHRKRHTPDLERSAGRKP